MMMCLAGIRARAERAAACRALRWWPAFTVTLPGASIGRLAPDHRDLVLLHQEADAVIEPFRHGARALHHRRGS